MPLSERLAAASLSGRPSQPTHATRPALLLSSRPPSANVSGALSFTGGAPVAPAGAQWPLDENGEPLGFAAQIDCATLPTAPGAPALPRTGVLYFFFPLRPGRKTGPWVRHVAQHANEWRPVPLPDRRAWAAQEASGVFAPWLAGTGQEAAAGPRSFPKYHLDPCVMIDIRGADTDPDPAPQLETKRQEEVRCIRRALAAADGPGWPERPERPWPSAKSLEWPHPRFPLTSRGALTATALLLQETLAEVRLLSARISREGDGAEVLSARAKCMQLSSTLRDALERWSALEKSGPVALSQDYRAKFHRWIASLDLSTGAVEGQMRTILAVRPVQSLNLALRSAARVDAESVLCAPDVDASSSVLSCASELEQWLEPCLTVPAKMFGHPTDLSGQGVAHDTSFHLLFQVAQKNLASADATTTLWQYWIRPDDLMAQRFDRSHVTMEAGRLDG